MQADGWSCWAPVNAVGIRSYSPEEAARIRSGIPGYRMVPAWEMMGDEDQWIEQSLQGIVGDPAGHRNPGAWRGGWWPTLNMLRTLFRQADVVAARLVSKLIALKFGERLTALP